MRLMVAVENSGKSILINPYAVMQPNPTTLHASIDHEIWEASPTLMVLTICGHI
jgi:hypothetical protein